MTDSSQQWSRVLALLDEALELEPGARAAWLAALEAQDAALATRLRELLALEAANRASGFLERSPLDAGADLIGQQIGPYLIERLLGRGGMGSVWLGRRNDGKFEGHAAIKVLERRGLGRDAAEQIRREASLLARLTHSNIARLFDAGVTASGQPYLVLEYVEGEPIDRYCSSRSLPLAARLRLFATVVDAVGHAHAHLVVHRDLKPSNVLVTAEGTVKLLDFGVASLQAESQPGDAEAPRALTPGYAAPEQLRGEPVAAASDVYALGVLLHVLVTGEHPFGARGTTETELMRAVLTEDPAPASARLGAPGERRRVRGDLDAIIARALRRDPSQRYATAAELADDVRAWLDHFPVHARPASRAYVARKFAQRHWGGVLSVVLTVLVLLAATIITTLQSVEARRQRDFARAQLGRAEALNEFNRYLLIDATPGATFTARQLLDKGLQLLERQTGNGPDRVAALATVGFNYEMLQDHAEGKRILTTAYDLSRATGDPSTRAFAACALANSLSNDHDSPRSRALIDEGLQILPDTPEFALDRFFCLSRGQQIARNAGDAQLAVRQAQAALATLDSVPVAHDVAEAYGYEELAGALKDAGRLREANAAFASAWPRLVALGRDQTRDAGTLLGNWSVTLFQMGRPLESEVLLKRCLDLEHADADPLMLSNYALLLYELDRLDAAADYAERAFAAGQRAGSPTVMNQSRLRLANIYSAQHRFAQAAQVLDDAEQAMHQLLPPGHYAFASVLLERALLADRQGDATGARRLADQALERLELAVRNGKAGGQFIGRALSQRARFELDGGDPAAAETDARRALALLTADAQPADYSVDTGRAYLALARALSAEGRGAAARGAAAQAQVQLARAEGADHPETRAAAALSGGG